APEVSSAVNRLLFGCLAAVLAGNSALRTRSLRRAGAFLYLYHLCALVWRGGSPSGCIIALYWPDCGCRGFVLYRTNLWRALGSDWATVYNTLRHGCNDVFSVSILSVAQHSHSHPGYSGVLALSGMRSRL